ncbi:MAG: hypothetical protein FWD11_10615 [Micrococcales bacterium]|nr:hypothetical protein [Micrococcales bacterium]
MTTPLPEPSDLTAEPVDETGSERAPELDETSSDPAPITTDTAFEVDEGPADRPLPPKPGSITTDAAQGAFRQALNFLLWLVGGLAVIGGITGFVVDGWTGVVSSTVAVVLVAFFCGTTVVSVQRTAGQPPAQMVMVVMGAWLVKMLVVFVVLAVLARMSWVHPMVLGIVLAVGVVGAALLDYRAVATARMPYIGDGDESHTGRG